MNRKFYLDTLQPADRLVIPKSGLNLVQHHAIYLGKDNYGKRMYIENAIGKGVQVVNEAYLFRGAYELTRVERFTGNQYQRNAAVQSAMQLIGKPYDLLNFNCEHYANAVQHRKSYSKQVGVGLGLGLFALVLGIGLSK
ncbi:MAG: lecithin retinol acyltransferase family protein [Bacteroidia bacterium]|nr:lecithin retinol acyltransferase family protein [Bacteroidia bacterium]